jgi:hypothetical protein
LPDVKLKQRCHLDYDRPADPKLTGILIDRPGPRSSKGTGRSRNPACFLDFDVRTPVAKTRHYVLACREFASLIRKSFATSIKIMSRSTAPDLLSIHGMPGFPRFRSWLPPPMRPHDALIDPGLIHETLSSTRQNCRVFATALTGSASRRVPGPPGRRTVAKSVLTPRPPTPSPPIPPCLSSKCPARRTGAGKHASAFRPRGRRGIVDPAASSHPHRAVKRGARVRPLQAHGCWNRDLLCPLHWSAWRPRPRDASSRQRPRRRLPQVPRQYRAVERWARRCGIGIWGRFRPSEPAPSWLEPCHLGR